MMLGPSAVLLIGFLTFIGGVCAIYFIHTAVARHNGPR